MRLLVSAGEQELLANVEVAERDQQIINLSGLNSATLLLRMKQKDIASCTYLSCRRRFSLGCRRLRGLRRRLAGDQSGQTWRLEYKPAECQQKERSQSRPE